MRRESYFAFPMLECSKWICPVSWKNRKERVVRETSLSSAQLGQPHRDPRVPDADNNLRFLSKCGGVHSNNDVHNEIKENSTSGVPTFADTTDTGNFFNTSPAWSNVRTIEYKQPNIQDYTIHPPPQNQLP